LALNTSAPLRLGMPKVASQHVGVKRRSTCNRTGVATGSAAIPRFAPSPSP
jgi:hypothetical protein